MLSGSNDNGPGDRPPPVAVENMHALLAAQAGVWNYDVGRDRLCYCLGAALAFGLPRADRASGLPLARLRGVVHPDDRALYGAQFAALLNGGGLINAMVRTDPALGTPRPLLLRGHAAPAAGSDGMRARGIVVDFSRVGPLEPGAGDAGALPPGLIAGIDFLIAARSCFAGLDPSLEQAALPDIDALLMRLGRVLARRVGPAARERPDGPEA